MPRSVCSALVALLLTPLILSPSHAQWVEPPGRGWVKLLVSHHDTQQKFGIDGRLEPLDRLDEEARAVTTTTRLSGALGLVRGVDAWIDVPLRRLQFDDAVADRQRTGISDPRLFLRVGPGLFGVENLPVAVALRGGVKFPVGDFAVDAEVIPLSEGQRDWELLLEMGQSLHPWPVYVMAWVGYRWREPNTSIDRKPGDERVFYVAAGGSAGHFRWKLALDGFLGRPPVRTSFDLKLENDRRELAQLIPTLGWQIGPGALEAGLRLPVHGRNLPAGPLFTLGYFVTWDNSPW